MQKWEYISFARVGGSWTDDRYDGRSVQDKLSDFGKEGWELVSVVYDSSGYNYFLKRLIEPRKRTTTTKAKSATKAAKTK